MVAKRRQTTLDSFKRPRHYLTDQELNEVRQRAKEQLIKDLVDHGIDPKEARQSVERIDQRSRVRL